jgi:hypothetical protein
MRGTRIAAGTRMPGNHEPSEDDDLAPELDRIEPGGRDGDRDDELDDPFGDGDEDDEGHRVVHRPNPLPEREEEEEELAEADILDELEIDEFDRRGTFF